MFPDTSLYSNNYSTLSVSSDLPVQVLYPYVQFKERSNSLFQNKEPVAANSRLFSTFYTNFRLIAKVEYLEDLSDGMYSFWNTLTPSIVSSLPVSKRLFCKLRFYYNSDAQIKEQTFDQFSTYNKYFYIEVR